MKKITLIAAVLMVALYLVCMVNGIKEAEMKSKEAASAAQSTANEEW